MRVRAPSYAAILSLLLLGCARDRGDSGLLLSDDPSHQVSTTSGDALPGGSADLRLRNQSAQPLYYLFQCDHLQGLCYELLGSQVLEPFESLDATLDPGTWYSLVIDEVWDCAWSGLYDLPSGGSYSWDIQRMDGVWDQDTFACLSD